MAEMAMSRNSAWVEEAMFPLDSTAGQSYRNV
jgi:hypothetical protein